jgi:hypothetical protein
MRCALMLYASHVILATDFVLALELALFAVSPFKQHYKPNINT